MKNLLTSERGAIAIEFAIVMSAVMVGFFSLMIYAGRVVQMEGKMQTAAQAGARAASITGVTTAESEARAAVAANLGELASDCVVTNYQMDPAVLAPPLGAPLPARFVEVELTCQVRPLRGPTLTLTTAALEPVDIFRGE